MVSVTTGRERSHPATVHSLSSNELVASAPLVIFGDNNDEDCCSWSSHCGDAFSAKSLTSTDRYRDGRSDGADAGGSRLSGCRDGLG